MRILVVDDDVDLADILREVLSSEGVAVSVAHSLAEVQAVRGEALESALAILDVNLGLGCPSGLDVSAWLRTQGFPGRVVFHTGHARSHPLVRAAASEPGAQILSKPIDVAALEGLISGHT